ncbi:MAG TPA: glycine zipper 2TM domain-containing protein [Allosphingosinicella sp.]|nr:glycine zipper 2TM domain-containing protein [Allosphingosinicella sp.]
MLKKISLAAVAVSTALTALPAAAEARPHRYYGDGYYSRGYDSGYYDSGYYGRGYGHRYQRGDYDGRGYGSRYYGRSRYYYGRCRDSGTTGTIIGAIAGGLIGHEVAQGGRYRRGDGTAGAIIGAGIGALAGREIDRDC